MAEIFTFAGSGAFGAATEAGRALQQALVQLGQTVRDGALMAVVVDGIVGPKTTAAVNRAFTTHIGPGQATAILRSGHLTQAQVIQYAPTLTQLTQAETARRGGPPAGTTPPATVPLPGNVPVPPNYEPNRTALWALAGIGLLAAAVGVYLAVTSEPSRATA